MEASEKKAGYPNGFVQISSKEYRDLVEVATSLRDENVDLIEENGRLEGDMREAQGEAERLRKELEDMRCELAKARNKAEENGKNFTNTWWDLEKARKRIAALESELAAKETENNKDNNNNEEK